MPSTSAYSTLNFPSSFRSYDCRRSARPITCSHRSCVPKARTPRTWVTVLASQPSVSMATDTTQRMVSPRRPGLPTVFIASRSRSWSVRFSAWRRSPVRSMISRRKRSISSAAIPPEILVEPLTALELLAVDEQCLRAGERVAMLVEVPEQRELAVLRRSRTVLVLALEAGDVVVDQLGGRGVVAGDDEARRHGDLRLLPQFERFLVMTVERLERRLKPRRKGEGIETSGFAASLLRHVLADVLPEISKHRHLAAGDVLRHGDARQLHDAALDGIHQRKVAHRPRKSVPSA